MGNSQWNRAKISETCSNKRSFEDLVLHKYMDLAVDKKTLIIYITLKFHLIQIFFYHEGDLLASCLLLLFKSLVAVLLLLTFLAHANMRRVGINGFDFTLQFLSMIKSKRLNDKSNKMSIHNIGAL
jgi:hypothetical protein